jgi:hypothetical protein
MYYVVDAAGRVVGTANYRPDDDDLRQRGERAVESDEDVGLDEAAVEGPPHAPRIVRRAREAAAPPAPRAEPRIELAASAEDEDGDGVPELIADARSRADIVATVHDAEGRPVAEPVELIFRTTAGTLARRRVTTEGGRAGVELRSSRETVTATVSVSAPGFTPARMQIEFVPIEPK